MQPPLILNESKPELSSGLSSYRVMFSKHLKKLDDYTLTNEQFCNILHNTITGLLRYEHDILGRESASILDILIARGKLHGFGQESSR